MALPLAVSPEMKLMYNQVHQAIALATPVVGRDFDVKIKPDVTGGLKVRLIPKNELGMVFCEYFTKNFNNYFDNPVEEFKLDEETND